MSKINFSTRKLNVINFLINLNDEKAFAEIESITEKTKQTVHLNLPVFTKSELVKRAKKSAQNIAENKIVSHSDLIKTSKKW